jgi:hypothetical protein
MALIGGVEIGQDVCVTSVETDGTWEILLINLMLGLRIKKILAFVTCS